MTDAITSPLVTGADLSHHNGVPDFSKIAMSGSAFVWLKANQGTFADPMFLKNWAAAKAAGLIRGAYCFLDPTVDPVVQADGICDLIGTLQPGDLPLAVDIEPSPMGAAGDKWPDVPFAGGRLAIVRAWVARVLARTGRQPLIYTFCSEWETSFGVDGPTAACPLWIASYRSAPSLPRNWPRYTFWQRSDRGSVNGVNGPVDTDQFNGTLDDLRTLAGYSTAAFPVVVAPPPPADPTASGGFTSASGAEIPTEGGV